MRTFIIIIVSATIGFIAGYVWNIFGTQVTVVTDEEQSIQQSLETPTNETVEQSEATQETTPEEPLVVNTNTLSPEQKKLLETFGINTDSIEVTAEMVVCAKAKVGEVRFEEILSGSTPTFFEGLSLASCYQQ